MQSKVYSRFIGITVMVTALLYSSTVSARFGHGHDGGLTRGRLSSALGLSDEQKRQIENLSATYRETGRSLYEQLREKRRVLGEATRAGSFDEAQVRSLAQEIATLQAELTVNHAKRTYQTLGVLTPEQRKKLDDLREQRLQRMKEWRERNPDRSDKRQS